MMGTLAAGDTQSEAALMKTIQDPQAFADRLQQLTQKTQEAQQMLEQAKANNVQAESERKQAEETHASTLELVRQIHAKEQDLGGREGALTARAGAISTAEENLSQRQAEHEAKVKTFEEAAAARNLELQKAEQAHTEKVAQYEAGAKQALADRVAVLEADYQKKAAALNTALTETNARANATKAAQELAEQTKLTYESKLAELRKLVGT